MPYKIRDITNEPCYCRDCRWSGAYSDIGEKLIFISGELDREMACPNCGSTDIKEGILPATS